MKIVIGIVVVFCSISSFAANLPIWSSGSVVLNNSDVRAGEISFQGPELILFKVDGNVTVYGPHQAKSFYFYDAKSNVNRKFTSMLVASHHAIFYEIVIWGEVQIIRHLKHRIVLETGQSEKNDYEYFVQLGDSIFKLSQFKFKVYPALLEKSLFFKEQIRYCQLNPEQESDAILMVKLYNKIATSSNFNMASSN